MPYIGHLNFYCQIFSILQSVTSFCSLMHYCCWLSCSNLLFCKFYKVINGLSSLYGCCCTMTVTVFTQNYRVQKAFAHKVIESEDLGQSRPKTLTCSATLKRSIYGQREATNWKVHTLWALLPLIQQSLVISFIRLVARKFASCIWQRRKKA